MNRTSTLKYLCVFGAVMIVGATFQPMYMKFGVQKVAAATKSSQLDINKDNFLDYFSLNGSSSYDKNTGILTLTPDNKRLSGNATFKNKIDMDQDISIKGEINLGNKSQKQLGADGISFGFFNGNSDLVGQGGGATGIGGLEDGFGWKADTYWNSKTSVFPDSLYFSDPSRYSGGDESKNGLGNAFGSFMYNQPESDGQLWTHTYDNSDAPAQQINEPSNNNFIPIEISYNGSTKQMNISYDGHIWNKDISTWVKSQSLSFLISASTGDKANLQQFRVDSISYHQAATVDVEYVDTNGNLLATGNAVYPNGAFVGGNYITEKKEFTGFTFIGMQKDSLPASGTLTDAGNNGTVVYVYKEAPQIGVADVTYIDDTTGKTLSTKNLQGNIGDKSDYATADQITSYENKGYELISDDFPTTGLVFSSDEQHYAIHLKHTTTTLTPDNPGEPGKPINPNDPNGVKWPNESGKDALQKIITQTIHYVYADGSNAANDIIDKSTFSHEIVVDNVTGEIFKDNGWSNDKNYFSKKDSPLIDGYTPSKSFIGKIEDLTQDSDDIEDTIVYTKKTITPVDPTDPTTPVKPELPNTNGETGSTVNTTLAQALENQKKSTSLPDTGTNLVTELSVFGALIAVFGTFGLFLDRKKNN